MRETLASRRIDADCDMSSLVIGVAWDKSKIGLAIVVKEQNTCALFSDIIFLFRTMVRLVWESLRK